MVQESIWNILKIITIAIFIEYLLCVGHCSKQYTDIKSFISHMFLYYPHFMDKDIYSKSIAASTCLCVES